jgi:hypothetical protein
MILIDIKSKLPWIYPTHMIIITKVLNSVKCSFHILQIFMFPFCFQSHQIKKKVLFLVLCVVVFLPRRPYVFLCHVSSTMYCIVLYWYVKFYSKYISNNLVSPIYSLHINFYILHISWLYHIFFYIFLINAVSVIHIFASLC